MTTMKFLIVMLALVFAANAAVIKSSNATRSNLGVGSIQLYDQLLKRVTFDQRGRLNEIQYQDFTYRGNYNTRISAVYAYELIPQYATASILTGGVGYNNVTLRLQSAKNYGYNFLIDIWGR